jgi:hypothetical protein
MKLLTNFSLIALLLLCSCDDILNKDPYDSISEERVWGDAGSANLYLNNLYNLTLPSFSASSNTSMCDETSGTNDYIYGRLEPEAVGDFSADTYAKIRKINILIGRLGTTGNIAQQDVERIKGQAYFLRAWIYWSLVNLYGGVPMVTSVQSLSISGDDGTPAADDAILVRRNKTGECIDTIVRDLDIAAKYLPPKWSSDADYGRITRGAAMAFKGRVLLFWASPQFNPLNKEERWQRAYEANKAAIDTLLRDGHDLHPSFTELFNDCKEKTAEAIFVRVYDAGLSGSYYHGYDNSVRPLAQGLNGGKTNNPTWQLVQAFPMNNGLPITNTSAGYSQALYWKDRDPRFYATIAYNSCTWPLSGDKSYKIWTYYVGDNSTEGSSASSTGFYCKKYVNPNILKANVTQVGTDWMEIRYAEVLLSFAECANEVGKKDEAIEAIRKIRERAWSGTSTTIYMGNIESLGKEDLREAIMRERQVELAFENKRYWDMRRRNMFTESLGSSTPAFNGTRRTTWREKLETNTVTEAMFTNMRNTLTEQDFMDNYTYYFQRATEWTMDVEQAVNYLQPKYSFLPIQQTNLQKNLQLEQTSYWGGTFDPLAE